MEILIKIFIIILLLIICLGLIFRKREHFFIPGQQISEIEKLRNILKNIFSQEEEINKIIKNCKIYENDTANLKNCVEIEYLKYVKCKNIKKNTNECNEKLINLYLDIVLSKFSEKPMPNEIDAILQINPDINDKYEELTDDTDIKSKIIDGNPKDIIWKQIDTCSDIEMTTLLDNLFDAVKFKNTTDALRIKEKYNMMYSHIPSNYKRKFNSSDNKKSEKKIDYTVNGCTQKIYGNTPNECPAKNVPAAEKYELKNIFYEFFSSYNTNRFLDLIHFNIKDNSKPSISEDESNYKNIFIDAINQEKQLSTFLVNLIKFKNC